MSIISMVVDQVQDQITQVAQQARDVENVMGAIRTGMGPIQGGAWVGQGARAFQEEVTNRLLPQIAELVAAIGGFGGGINQAMDIIHQCDGSVRGVVEQLGGVFDSIF